MFSILRASLGEAWEDSVRLLLQSSAVEVVDGRAGGPCHQIYNVVMHCTEPQREPRISKHYGFARELAKHFTFVHTNASAEAREIRTRIRSWKCGRQVIDQLERVTELLRASPSTQRGIISLWNPKIDLFGPSPICPVHLHLYRAGGALSATVTVRSGDAWMAAPLDLYAFAELQASVANDLGWEVGTYTHHVVAYHLYLHHKPIAERALVDA